MTIPESQLKTWSNQGATATAQTTHNSIRNALDSYTWPSGVTYETYLQGSYRNSTNIRGDSDVDLVAEVTSIAYSNLTDREKSKLGIESASYNWSTFREHVIKALTNYYGEDLIDITGSKSIKVLPASGRLKADVVVCAAYHYYSNLKLIAEGMTFWTIPGWQQIINYPKLHYSNGADKNSNQHTNGWYKPSIRMFKNARSRILDNKPALKGRFPSYFIECLLYNVPDRAFGSSFQSTYIQVVDWLIDEFANERVGKFICQNEMTYLFGTDITQWNVADAREYADQLIILWNKR